MRKAARLAKKAGYSDLGSHWHESAVFNERWAMGTFQADTVYLDDYDYIF